MRLVAAFAIGAALLPAGCSSRSSPSLPAAVPAASGKEIVVNTDKGEAEAQAAGARTCAQQGKRAELTGYTCAEGTCKVLRYTFDCV